MERGAAHDITDLHQPTAAEHVEKLHDIPTVVDGQHRLAAIEAPFKGLEFPRFFTLPGVDPFDEITWEQRSAVIGNERGEVVFDRSDGVYRVAGVRFAPLPARAAREIARFVDAAKSA